MDDTPVAGSPPRDLRAENSRKIRDKTQFARFPAAATIPGLFAPSLPRPPAAAMDSMPRRIPPCWLAFVITVVTVAMTTSAMAADTARPVSVRIRWGGGTPQAWSGRIDVAATDNGPAPPFDWQTLSGQPDAAATTFRVGGNIVVRQTTAAASDGVEVTIHDWHRARLVVELGPVATGTPTVTVDVPLAQLFETMTQEPLDEDGNRLVIERAAGDDLRIEFEDAARARVPVAFGSVRQPGEQLRLWVTPLLLMKPGGGDVELHARLLPARQESVIDSRILPVAAGSQRPDLSTPSGQIPTAFAPVACDFTLPNEEGAFDIVLEAVERRGIRWNRQLASRRIQVVAIATEPPPSAGDEPWKVVYELDPASPRLHERLRRLPARGFQAVPKPSLTLPAMPLPSFTRPSLTMPRMPEVPLPNVPMPAVQIPDMSSLVPRLGGLLASGHSTVTPHPLGPMLRLPKAPSPRSPSWEGIVIANARPGAPHAVEIEYPTDQRATLAACVLEPDAAGTMVEIRHAGGFESASTVYDGPPRLGTHRFVFWPTTRQPLLVIANPMTTGSALVGHVRVSAGPARLPALASSGAARLATGERRKTLALMPSFDLTQRFGGPTHVARETGRPTTDWISHLIAIRHSADAIRAQGIAGGLVAVYAGGTASWPSRLTQSASRWAAADPGDGTDHDLLAATARIYAREGLAFVPSLRFDGAIPALETLRASDEGTGIACVGRDGRPRPLGGGIHYNILDPRVQQAVESIVTEAVARLGDTPTCNGIAILLPDDGWLHLPGVAWGLDDATFARFLAAIGEREGDQAAERFAARSQLVTGPLRNEWLAWRSAELTAFYARLAVKVDDGAERKLYVMPTTLFATGELASRFKPGAAAGTPHDDLLREYGLVGGQLSPELPKNLVFVPPHVATPGSQLMERSTIAIANAGIARSSSASATSGDSRATAIVVRPLDINLTEVLPHGPFPSATLAHPCPLLIEPVSATGDAMLAKSLAATDANVVFDMRPVMHGSMSGISPDQGFESLPGVPFHSIAPCPAPLVVRTLAANGATWVQLVNASAAPVDVSLKLTVPNAAVIDAVSGVSLPVTSEGAAVSLAPWAVRALVIDGGGAVGSVRALYAPTTCATVAASIEKARQRIGVLTNPEPLDVLDNPGFELGLADAPGAHLAPAVTGWELLEQRRGSIDLIPGLTMPASTGGRALRFSSRNGLSTVRSNPFAPPATGRVSVAAWLRLDPDEPQPPLRIAIEGLEGNREYYRFAPIGGLAGGKPLTADWAMFVLQVDDLPTESVESLRVRFDLLGPGNVQIDEVRVYDLAFDESQRSDIAKTLARIDHQFKAGDVGGAIIDLEGHWPAFLEAFVSDAAVAARQEVAEPQTAVAPAPPDEPRQGMLDRFRGWW